MIYKTHIGKDHDCDYYGDDEQDCYTAPAYHYTRNLIVYQRNNLDNHLNPFHSNSGLREQKIFEKDKYTEQ